MESYIGQIFLFAGDFAPKNFALCNGQILSIAQNQALFSILGTTYGGNGVNTFGLPDLRGAALVSAGQAPGRSFYALGQVGGSENVTLNQTQLPVHIHTTATPTVPLTINVSEATPDATSPDGAVPAKYDAAPLFAAAPDTSTALGGVTPAISIGVAGSSQPVPTLPPYLVLNYCICINGLYPPRN